MRPSTLLFLAGFLLVQVPAALAQSDHGQLAPFVAQGNLARVGELLDQGLSIQDPGLRGASLLHVAVASGQPEMVAFLIERGADLDARDDSDCTPLHLAAALGKPDCARVLLDAGTDPDVRGYQSRDGSAQSTPLILAAEMGSLEVAEILVSRGADVNVVNAFDRTPLFWARKAGKSEMASYLEGLGATADPEEARAVGPTRQGEVTPPEDAEEVAPESGEAAPSGEVAPESDEPAPPEEVAPESGEAVPLPEPRPRSDGAVAPLEDRRPEAARLLEEGSAHRKAGRLDAALAALSAAVRLAPRSASIRSQLCLTLHGLGRKKAAAKQLRLVGKLDPRKAKKLRRHLEKTRR